MQANGQSQPTRRRQTTTATTKTDGRERGERDAITNFLFALKTKAEHAEKEGKEGEEEEER